MRMITSLADRVLQRLVAAESAAAACTPSSTRQYKNEGGQCFYRIRYVRSDCSVDYSGWYEC
ncbi:hypothetical protein LX16_2900 [Stackebrandtia albiflava]|uniref:Uncharacterized protein n=1 Tax=Stackebrandtia albiflava TaxID=406432 RepID=A0A562V2W4_9ACTN|nr:hypothetical protein [Stackebrandtia albiflava]TWJ12147.1 hypothetical protein LX16_2900 [Stackebrandtia albiflava]